LPSTDGNTDFIVIGAGAAGLTGALVAALGGARVTVLEKADMVGGTTAMSGGGLWIACNPHMHEVGVSDSREEALTYLRACAGELADEAMLASLVDNGPDMVRLLEGEAGLTFQVWPAVGGTIDYRPWLPGAKPGGRNLECMGVSMAELGPWADRLRKEPRLRSATNLLDYYAKQYYLMPPRPGGASAPGPEVDTYWRGTALIAQLLRACLARGVEIHVGAQATDLVAEDGRVVGVKALQDGAPITFHAPHVLMASGGYTNNEELKRLWLDRPLTYTCDVTSNQGDGHLMGAAIGAQLAGLGDAWWMPHIPLGMEGNVVNAGGTREDRILPHTLIVNMQAKRFMNEALNYYDAGKAFGAKSGAEPRNFPAWFIFDRQGVERYALLAWKVPPGDPPEWLHVADSIDALAKSIGVDAHALKTTVERFNGFARSGVDEEFGRGDNAWDRAWGDPKHKPNPSLGTIEKGPFYALPIHPGAIATRGGLRVDPQARVLSVRGAPIPGLYAAGNCSNASAPGAYCGPGATIGAAMTFGYLAGRQAATPPPIPGLAVGQVRDP
jgi:3-oxosteroid 1-dehydrogenase